MVGTMKARDMVLTVEAEVGVTTVMGGHWWWRW